MNVKIYFKDKPLFLGSVLTSEMETFAQQDNVFIISQYEKNAIKECIRRMEESETKGGILLFEDVGTLLNNLKKELTVMQAGGGFIYNKSNQVLLIFRRGRWDLPKGKLDEGEDLATCALREVKEETGLEKITLIRHLHTTYHTYFQDGLHILKESHWFIMKAEEYEKPVPQTEEDIEKCEWVAVEHLVPYLENAHASISDVVRKGLQAIHLITKA